MTTTYDALALGQEEILDNIYSFLDRLNILLDECVAFGAEQEHFNLDSHFIRTFKEIQLGAFSLLQEKETRSTLENWLETLDEKDLQIISLIAAEMHYYLQRYPTLEINSSNVEIERNSDNAAERGKQLEHGLENGKTIKDSLEKFLGEKITNFFKKALSVVNELLSIAKTFI